jgi:hypothetical protein
MKKIILGLALVASLGACRSAEVTVVRRDLSEIPVKFYRASGDMDDLLIVRGINHFGTASYDDTDNLTDLAFRFNSGQKIIAECVRIHAPTGVDVCELYEILKSNFGLIPEGARFYAPRMY